MTAPVTVTQADRLLVAQIGHALEELAFDRADNIAARHRQQAEAASKAREAEYLAALDAITACYPQNSNAYRIASAARAKASSNGGEG